MSVWRWMLPDTKRFLLTTENTSKQRDVESVSPALEAGDNGPPTTSPANALAMPLLRLSATTERVRVSHNATPIVVTHDMVTAFDAADRVALLADGKIGAQARPRELLS